MDAVGLYVLLAFVVIAPLVWALVARRVRAAARRAGTAAGLNLEERVAASTAKGLDRDAALLGTRLRFPAGSAGREIVAEALAGVKAATATADGWSISHGIPDMVTAVWRDEADGGGAFLAVRARQSLGSFVQTRTWSKTLDAISRVGEGRGVTPTVETVPLVPSAEVVDGDPVWVAAS